MVDETKKNVEPKDVKNKKHTKKITEKKDLRKKIMVKPITKVPKISHSQTSRYHKSQGDLSYRYKMELLKRKTKRKRK